MEKFTKFETISRIKQGNIEGALDMLLDNFPIEFREFNKLLLLKSQLQNIKNKVNLGLEEEKSARTEINRITNSTLELLALINDTEFVLANQERENKYAGQIVLHISSPQEVINGKRHAYLGVEITNDSNMKQFYSAPLHTIRPLAYEKLDVKIIFEDRVTNINFPVEIAPEKSVIIEYKLSFKLLNQWLEIGKGRNSKLVVFTTNSFNKKIEALAGLDQIEIFLKTMNCE